MACPLFIPSSPLGELVSGAVPLGDLYAGHCAAAPTAPIDAETLRRYCNFGYARGHCERASQSDADAARFMVRAAHGDVVEIAWSVERNHHPVAVGIVAVDTSAMPAATEGAKDGTEEDVQLRQAYACAWAYARQTREIAVGAGS